MLASGLQENVMNTIALTAAERWSLDADRHFLQHE